MRALTAEQARQVLEAARSDEPEALWALALTSGLRQGELLALKWPDIDLERGSLRVVASLVRMPGQEPVLAEPKSWRSRRQVELSAAAVDALRRHRANNPSIAFVFSRPDGRPLSVTTTWKLWRRLLERAKVPPMPFHSARHSAASLLLGRGVHPKIVSEMLGHSTVAITWRSTRTSRRRCTARPRASWTSSSPNEVSGPRAAAAREPARFTSDGRGSGPFRSGRSSAARRGAACRTFGCRQAADWLPPLRRGPSTT